MTDPAGIPLLTTPSSHLPIKHTTVNMNNAPSDPILNNAEPRPGPRRSPRFLPPQCAKASHSTSAVPSIERLPDPKRAKRAKELLLGLRAVPPGMVRRLELAVADIKGRLGTGGGGHGIKW